MVGMFNPYLHGVFAILLYLVGNFFTIIILEYKLKNVNLKHTLAGFACVALSGIFAYFVPIFLFQGRSSMVMQLVGIGSALAVQGLFWWFWFRKNLKKFAPALIVAFVLSVVIAFLFYNAFVWYVTTVAKGAVKGAAVGAAKNVTPF